MIDIPLSALDPPKKKKVKKAPVAVTTSSEVFRAEKTAGGTLPIDSMKELVRSTISRCKNKWPSLLAHAKIVEKYLDGGK